MTRECQYSGRKPVAGRHYTIRGIAKKLKGIGLKTTSKTKRRFVPNVIKKRFWLPEENRFVTLKLSANAIRTSDRIGIGTIVAEMRAAGQKI